MCVLLMKSTCLCVGKEEEYLTDVKALSQYLNDQQEIEDRTQHGTFSLYYLLLFLC